MRINVSKNGAMPGKNSAADRGKSRNGFECCMDLICTQHVMTLATSSSQGAWTAPVYYYYKDRVFFFFSSISSRHIKEALTSELCCAASIFEDQWPINKNGAKSRTEKTGFDQIRGIQMSGRINHDIAKATALKATAGYIKRFGIYFNCADGLAFIETRFHAKLFCFVPDEIFYMDNAVGFGNREKIRL